MDPKELRLFYEPKDRLRLTVGGDRSYPTVKPAWAAPLSKPDTYLALLDGKGDEIVLLKDPSALPPDSLDAVKVELRRRYLTSTVLSVTHARQEFGASYWSVETDRGERDFVTQNLQENAQWFSPTHLLLIDVDGNRFEIPNLDALDSRSLAFVHTIL